FGYVMVRQGSSLDDPVVSLLLLHRRFVGRRRRLHGGSSLRTRAISGICARETRQTGNSRLSIDAWHAVHSSRSIRPGQTVGTLLGHARGSSGTGGARATRHARSTGRARQVLDAVATRLPHRTVLAGRSKCADVSGRSGRSGLSCARPVRRLALGSGHAGQAGGAGVAGWARP
ncbi:hypothetical protein PFISCL1PPCAC_13533, partial [Pristionchus fissidentatus]